MEGYVSTEEVSASWALPKQLTGIHTRIKVFVPGVIWEELLPIDMPEVEGNGGHNSIRCPWTSVLETAWYKGCDLKISWIILPHLTGKLEFSVFPAPITGSQGITVCTGTIFSLAHTGICQMTLSCCLQGWCTSAQVQIAEDEPCFPAEFLAHSWQWQRVCRQGEGCVFTASSTWCAPFMYGAKDMTARLVQKLSVLYKPWFWNQSSSSWRHLHQPKLFSSWDYSFVLCAG